MDRLTSTEKRALNGLSRKVNPSIFLGDMLDNLINENAKEMESGTPVNAVNARVDLGITGAVIDGETVSVNNPLKSGVDTYEFLTDSAQTKTVESNIGVDISRSAVKASGSLTLTDQPTSGDKVTIGTKVYTFVPVGTATADGEVSIGADLAAAKLALVAAINGTDGVSEAHPLVHASAFVANDCVIEALIGGSSGNNIATTETFTAETNVFADVKLALGADCSAANAITAFALAVATYDTQDVSSSAGDGKVTLIADNAGISGNNIVVSEAMANAAFALAAVKLSGGVNGTIGEAGAFMVDDSYLYACPVANTVTGANWRRISLGSSF